MWGRNRYIHRKQFKGALVPNTFSVAYARRDEPDDRESRPGGETILRFGFFYSSLPKSWSM